MLTKLISNTYKPQINKTKNVNIIKLRPTLNLKLEKAQILKNITYKNI